jgi:hypothetical protein
MDNAAIGQGSLKRTNLGIYLALQCYNGPRLRYAFFDCICNTCCQLMYALLKTLGSSIVYFQNSHAHLKLFDD